VPGVLVDYWVTVRITESNPLAFLGVLGGNKLGIAARSTAAVIPANTTACVVALDPSAQQALAISGSASVRANNCGVAVASSSTSAISVTGGGALTASSVEVVGGVSGTANINPAPTTVASVSNPYANLAIPTFSTTCTYTNYTLNGGSATISPGTYCGGIKNSNGSLTLNPGTYILYGSNGLQGSGSATFSGAGVFFYSTCNPSPCNGNSDGELNFSGQTNGTFSAPTSGAYTGIIYFQDPTAKLNGAQATISGGSSSCFTGVIYVPRSYLTYSGGSSAGSCDTSLVADTVTFSGSANIGSSAIAGSGPSAPTAMLIE
jgi:hypothetical protein